MKSDEEQEVEEQAKDSEDTSVKVEVDGAPNADSPIKAEETRAESPEEQILRLEDLRLRAVAELDNYRKRTARQFEELLRTANDRVLVDLLEVVDSFERALEHAGENSESRKEDSGSFEAGIKLIYTQLIDLLKKYDVRPMEALGQPFDPNKHEALMQAPSDEYENGTVATELVKGYMISDRVLRHSKVSVSTGPAESKSDDSKR